MEKLWEFFPCFIFAAFAFLAVFGIAWSIWSEKKRTEAMTQAANDLGLPFFPTGDPSLINELSHFKLFSQGRSRTISNMIHGDTAAVTVGIFDYKYVTGSGKNRTTHVQTVISFESSALDLPQFLVRPEHLFDKIGGVLGFKDIDFETHPAFSKSYMLQGSEEERIRETFTPELLSFFETMSGITVEGAGNRLVYFRSRKRMKPQETRKFMEEGFKIYAQFKSE